MDLQKKIPQPVDQAMYLRQVMKLGKVECLVIFDTGANTNMIDGHIAEILDLQVVDQSSTVIKGVGDSKVSIDFGTYKINLGPTLDGKYHEMIAYGTSCVTGQLPKFDLDEVKGGVDGNWSNTRKHQAP